MRVTPVSGDQVLPAKETQRTPAGGAESFDAQLRMALESGMGTDRAKETAAPERVPRSSPDWTPETDNAYRWGLLDPQRAPAGLQFKKDGVSTSNDIYETYYEVTPFGNIVRYDIVGGANGPRHVTFIPNPEPRLVQNTNPESGKRESNYLMQHSAYHARSRAQDHPLASGPPSWFVPKLSEIWLRNALEQITLELLRSRKSGF